MLWACVDCTARYAVGATACPQCGSTKYQEAPGGVVEDGAPVLDCAPSSPEPAPTLAAPAKPKTTASEAKP